LDQGGFPSAHDDTDGAAHFDEYHAYDALLALYPHGELITRFRIELPPHGGRRRHAGT